MEIKRVIAGIYGANCYIIMDENTKEAVVLDPGGDVDDIYKAIKAMGAEVKYILLTHGHVDHTSGVDELQTITKAKVGMDSKDNNLILKGEYLFGPLTEKGADIILKENDIIKCGSIEVKCIETPGHTPGGMSFVIDNMVFTGDTLFAGSVGRTDFVGGDHYTLINSIQTKLMILPEDTVVYPGHGPSSTVNREKIGNPFL